MPSRRSLSIWIPAVLLYVASMVLAGAADAWGGLSLAADVPTPASHGAFPAVPRAESDQLTAPPDELGERVRRAAQQGAAAGFDVEVSVVDLGTGDTYDAGDTRSTFGTASVVKVMIAARLLAEGEMTGDTEQLATAMIERSDDDAANTLWSQAGGPALEPWVQAHWGVSGLGSPNDIPGRWGNTHVAAHGLAKLYVALRNDHVVWPWLSARMHAVERYAADGTDQGFGLLAVDPGSAVKQGWADGSADAPGDITVNSTGYAHGDGLVVVLLTEGPAATDAEGFSADQAAVVTTMAHTVLG